MPEVGFTLNGTRTEVSYPEGMRALELLRERCGVRSPKDGCAPQGACGCCTVLVDGRPMLSCLKDPQSLDGREVVTLEGLDERLRDTLTRAFVRDGAMQCGFCSPGIVVRAAALVEQGATDDREALSRALSGHLCRCTGYTRILDAIQTAGEAWEAGELPEGGPRDPQVFGERYGLQRDPALATDLAGHGVGACSARFRGADHAVGAKEYVADLEREGMLHGAVVLAEHPRATVTAIDSAAAAALPGVERVFTADDVPGDRVVGLIVRDWPVFVAVGETTHCVGDVLALVVADSQHAAREAAAAVRVEYDVHTPVTDVDAALAPDAPSVHPDGNLLETCAFARGDVDAALAASAHVLEETFHTQRIEHAFLEPEACLAWPEDEWLRVASQGQGVHDDQRQIAAMLDVDVDRVHVELVSNGGAFGGKEDLSIQAQTALAAWLLRRPVRTVLTRDQSILMHPKRHPIRMHYTVGADEHGKLTAVRARMVGDTGAYASVGAKVLERAAGHSCGPYAVPNVDIEAKSVRTNNPPCGAMRGFGANQASFAIEGMLDRLAAQVGIDGYDVRERNLLRPGDRFATGQRMSDSCGVLQTLQAVRDVYKNAPRAGIACGIKNTGIGNGMPDGARVRIDVADDGALDVVTGYTEMGQGLFTILRQAVHEETGLPVEAITVRTVSDADVQCGMTTASRATALTTAAAQIAARELNAALDGGHPGELAGRSFHGEYVCDFTTSPGDPTDDPRTHLTFGYATQVVLLDADGMLERVVAAHDVGRAINPLLCAGQIEGAVHMGLGYALSEDLPCEGGVPVSTKLRDCGVLRSRDTPPIDVILLEVPDEVGGYGAKGVGEIGLVPTAGAVAGALQAWDGAWRVRLPMADVPAATAAPASRRRASS